MPESSEASLKGLNIGSRDPLKLIGKDHTIQWAYSILSGCYHLNSKGIT